MDRTQPIELSKTVASSTERQDAGSRFDHLARPYRWLEYAVFGRGLLRCRFDLLPWLADAKRVLTVGEGDGRFVAELVRRFPKLQVDCVEASAAMIVRAQARLPAEAKVTFYHADARELDFSKAKYDAMVTCFFLDCFSEKTLADLMPRMAASVRPEGQWLVAEFGQPSRGWPAWHARGWLALMYFFFRLATRLEARRLPDWEREMARLNFACSNRITRRWSLMASTRWKVARINSQNSR
ncbi:MAG: class I SAM-dependent methyltransferase [Verrucomicrobia subdivision 3 bacterium]|nr:class I SAM-dependent methyltransferase [Limisphaerales bacterium]